MPPCLNQGTDDMKYLAWLLLTASINVGATDFVCNGKANRYDLMDAYAGRPVLIGNTFVTAYILPSNHPDSIAAFGELGLSPTTAERLAKSSGLVDRYIKLTTPDQMLIKVEQTPPSVGYVPMLLGARNAKICR